MNHVLVAISLLMLPFNTVDKPPEFKGGSNALTSFLLQNLIYPDYSKQNCISGTIQVSFNIEQNGKLSHVKVYKGLGIDLDDEAVRLVRLTSGKWTVPAGYNSKEQLILPIRFYSEDARCAIIDKQSVNMAIQAYRSHEQLVNAVTNYYSNKYLGKADTTKEDRILALKKQLGFDDDYIDEVMQQAHTKFKQGDHDSACEDWLFVRNIGSDRADQMLSKNCH